jgi:REP element-mobilizing transposase RayT
LKLKPHPYRYRRNLPHIQKAGHAHFITFSTYKRWHLPESVRGLVRNACLFWDGQKLEVHALVVMPDHVHLLATFLHKPDGTMYQFREVMRSIKSYSAREVNRALGRTGTVWLDESFDHVLRADESIESKEEYLRMNPVKAGLVAEAERYPWLWSETLIDWDR